MLFSHQQRFGLAFNKLELLNPLSILDKGYSVVTKNDVLVKSYKDLKVDDIINIKLKNGNIKACVKEVNK